MAYTHDWTGTDAAAWSADWATSSTGAGTVDILTNRGRMLSPATAFVAQRAILGSGLFNVADGEIYVEMTTAAAATDQQQIYSRTTGDWDAGETDSPTSGYKWLINPAGNTLEMYVRTGGVTTGPLATAAFTFATSTSYGCRYRYLGSEHWCKIWSLAGSEPAAWNMTLNNSVKTTIGQMQLSSRPVSATAITVTWDNLSAQTAPVHTQHNRLQRGYLGYRSF